MSVLRNVCRYDYMMPVVFAAPDVVDVLTELLAIHRERPEVTTACLVALRAFASRPEYARAMRMRKDAVGYAHACAMLGCKDACLLACFALDSHATRLACVCARFCMRSILDAQLYAQQARPEGGVLTCVLPQSFHHPLACTRPHSRLQSLAVAIERKNHAPNNRPRVPLVRPASRSGPRTPTRRGPGALRSPAGVKRAAERSAHSETASLLHSLLEALL